MADPTLIDQLTGLAFNARELAERTEWPPDLIEDYLTILENINIIAEGVDVGLPVGIVMVSADYTTEPADGLILVNASANAVTVSFDLNPDISQNHSIKIVDDTFACKVNPNGNTLDRDVGLFQMIEDESIDVRYDGAGNWWIL